MRTVSTVTNSVRSDLLGHSAGQRDARDARPSTVRLIPVTVLPLPHLAHSPRTVSTGHTA